MHTDKEIYFKQNQGGLLLRNDNKVKLSLNTQTVCIHICMHTYANYKEASSGNTFKNELSCHWSGYVLLFENYTVIFKIRGKYLHRKGYKRDSSFFEKKN